MKIISIIYSFLLILTVSTVSSCDFAEKNINPNSSSTIEPKALLASSLLHTSDYELCKRTQVGLCMMIVQQTASLERNEMAGDKYLTTESVGKFFTIGYSSHIKNIQELINLTENEESLKNTHAIALIWRAFLFQRITDLYGDIPFREAGNGYVTQNFYPRYDQQSDIYAGLIEDIEKGISLLDNSQPSPQGDIIYNEDINKWSRFAYSLLLRVGMRMEKVNPELAKATVLKAVNGGVMQEVSDICMVRHEIGKNATENPLGKVFALHELLQTGVVKISQRFMSHLLETEDPRLGVYCALPDGQTDRELQRGLPNGYDAVTISKEDPTYTSLDDYSTFNPATILQLDAPTVHMTHAETELLLAEATLKGWISGDVKQHYENAVRSSMKQQELLYGEEGVIKEEQIEAYMARNMYDNASSNEEKLALLGTEFWVASFLNGTESYAHWRRTGYPELQATSYSGSPNKGSIPRRLTYPTEEYSINKENMDEAISRQGQDTYATRMWWDKNTENQ